MGSQPLTLQADIEHKMIEEDCDFDCPYCGDQNSVRLEATAGKKQSFIQDCVTCCKPIQIRTEFNNDTRIEFSAESVDG